MSMHVTRVLLRAVACCLVTGLAGCSISASPPPTARSTAKPASLVRVRSATIEYYLAGPGDPVVELRVFLETSHTRHTESTSILWDPEFARQFVFLRSEPEPWRVRIDESGWGSLDTTGVIPGEFATYRLWFAAGTPSAIEPRIKIIADGDVLVAETVAAATHLKRQAPAAPQNAFERGPLAGLTGFATFLPAGSRSVFLYAVVLALTLLGVTLDGGVKAFRSSAR
ncbi:MAG: hypothetical protein ACR2NO_08445 [Chloroflexota bacterium]